MGRKNQSLRDRFTAAAEELLARQHYVAPVEVLLAVRWLDQVNIDTWRKARVDDLQDLAGVGADRLAEAIAILVRWA